MNLILQLSNHVKDSQILWRGLFEDFQILFHYPLHFFIFQSRLKDNAAHYMLLQTHIDIQREICLYIYLHKDLTKNILLTAKLITDDTSVFSFSKNTDKPEVWLKKNLQKYLDRTYQWKIFLNPDIFKQAQKVIFSRKNR